MAGRAIDTPGPMPLSCLHRAPPPLSAAHARSEAHARDTLTHAHTRGTHGPHQTRTHTHAHARTCKYTHTQPQPQPHGAYMHMHMHRCRCRCAALLSPLTHPCAAQHLFRPPAGTTLPLTLDDAARLPFFLRAAPRQPGAADALLPPPDRQERALLQRLGLLAAAEEPTNSRLGRHPRRRSRSLTHSYASSAAADSDVEAGGCECTHSGYDAGP